MRDFKCKDREMVKALSKCSEGTGGLSKRTDPFGQCNLPSKLSYKQVLYLQITHKPLALLVTHNRMWALAPYRKWKDSRRRV